jgi:hypothetical protein
VDYGALVEEVGVEPTTGVDPYGGSNSGSVTGRLLQCAPEPGLEPGTLALNRGLLSLLSYSEWQRGRDSNPQTSRVKAGRLFHFAHRAMVWCPELGSNRRRPPCRGGALPLSYRGRERDRIRTRDALDHESSALP